MGSSESTVWDRYVPTPPPGEDKNDDQRQKQAKTNTSDTQSKQQDKSNKNEEKLKATKNNENEKAKQTTKSNTADNKIKQEAEPKANDVKDEQPKSAKDKEKKESSTKDNSKKANKIIKARTQLASNEGPKRPQMKHGVERKDIDDELAYDPMANFLEQKEVNKDKSRVNDDMFMIRKKPLGPRWKPKVDIRNEDSLPLPENNSENKHIPKSIGTSAGPERKPKMKVGYMIDDLDQGRYSLHGNFVLSPVQTNIAWADS